MPRFGGIPYDGIADRATRQAFRRLCEVMGNMFLTGNAADRPTSARLGAYWVTQDADQEVYWYAGESIGWLLIASLSAGGGATLEHNLLKSIQGGLSAERYHLQQNSYQWACDLAVGDTGAWGLSGRDYSDYAYLQHLLFGQSDDLVIGVGGTNRGDHTEVAKFISDGTKRGLVICGGAMTAGDDLPGQWHALHLANEHHCWMAMSSYNDTPAVRPNIDMRHARGTKAVPSAVQSADWLGSFAAYGHDGSDFANVADWQFLAAENFGPSNHGATIRFRAVRPGTANTRDTLLELGDEQVLVGKVGSASRPSLAFLAYKTDGLYSSASGQIAMALAASKRFEWKSPGVYWMNPHAASLSTDGEIAALSTKKVFVGRFGGETSRFGGAAYVQGSVSSRTTSGYHSSKTISASQWVEGKRWTGIIGGTFQLHKPGSGSAYIDWELRLGTTKIADMRITKVPADSAGWEHGFWQFEVRITVYATGSSNTMSVWVRPTLAIDSGGFPSGWSEADISKERLAACKELASFSTSSSYALRVYATIVDPYSGAWSKQTDYAVGPDLVH